MTKIIAHRGYSSRAPENTMAAFAMALDFSVDGLELDVQLSKDGEVVICHDESLKRTTNLPGLVKDYTWEELRYCDAGSWFGSEFAKEGVPSLRQLFDLVKGHDVLINIEFKNGVIPYPDLEERVAALLKEYDLVEQAIISSFNHYSLVKMKNLFPQIKTGILYMAGLYEPWDYAHRLKADALHPFHFNIQPEIVVGVKEHSLMLNPFTVDELSHIHRVVSAGVDGIITNYPERVRQLLSERI